MTIKQQGGIFGRNPTFNDVDVEGSLTAGPITGTTLTATGAFTSLGIDDNAPSTAVTITSSNKVGINTTSPSYPLVVSDGGASGIELVPGAAAGLSQIIAINRSGGTYDTLRLNALNHSFNTSGSTRMTIDASGHAIIPQGVTLGTAAGVYNAANTIDDYEEGTFSAVLADASSGGNTASTGNTYAQYTKVGNVVHCTISMLNINTSGMTSGNVAYLQGLPYVAVSAGANKFFPIYVRSNGITSTIGIQGWILANGGDYIFLENLTTSGKANLLVSAFSSGTADLAVSFSYFTS